MSNLDSLPLAKNLSYRNMSPKNYELSEPKPPNFFSPFGPIKVIKLLPNANSQNNITNNNFQIYNQNINIFPPINIAPIKKTLVLDLDETLVHSSMTPFEKPSDITLTINVKGKFYNVYVLKRPHLEEFLLEMSHIYEIIVFTASLKEYADPLIKIIDKHKVVKYVLNREHCLFEYGVYIKDLGVIQRKLENLIIIDNNPISYLRNKENGIPILSWYDDLKDNELIKIIPLLRYLSRVNDVRPIISQIVIKKDEQEEELNYNLIEKIINENNEFNSFNVISSPNYNFNSNENNLNDKINNLMNNNNHNPNIKYFNIEQNINNNINNNQEKDNNNIDINKNIIKKIYVKKHNINSFNMNEKIVKNKEEKLNSNINNNIYKQKDIKINNFQNNNINNKANNNPKVINPEKINNINFNINGIDNNDKTFRLETSNYAKQNNIFNDINKENESINMNKTQRNKNNLSLNNNNNNDNLKKELNQISKFNNPKNIISVTPNQTDKKVIRFYNSSNNFFEGKPEKTPPEKLNITQDINIKTLNNINKFNNRTPIKNINLPNNNVFKKSNERDIFNILQNEQNKNTNNKINNNINDFNENEMPKVIKIYNGKSDSKGNNNYIFKTSKNQDKNNLNSDYFQNKSYDIDGPVQKTERSPVVKRLNCKKAQNINNYRPQTKNILNNNIMNYYKNNPNKTADNAILKKKNLNIKINDKNKKTINNNLQTEIDISQDKSTNIITKIEVVKSPRKEKLSKSPYYRDKIKFIKYYGGDNKINNNKSNNTKVKKKEKENAFNRQKYLQENFHINN